MNAIRKTSKPSPAITDRGAQGPSLIGPAAGGPVKQLHAELTTRLSDSEYEAWLLPPQRRDSFETAVQWLSVSAGAGAMIGALGLIWWAI